MENITSIVYDKIKIESKETEWNKWPRIENKKRVPYREKDKTYFMLCHMNT
jgi:hypothetical protein